MGATTSARAGLADLPGNSGTGSREPGAVGRARAGGSSVMGVHAAAPRPTGQAMWLALRYLGLPLIGGLFVIDLLIWAIGLVVFDTCVAIWC